MSANETADDDGSTEPDWDAVGFILASEYRKGVIGRLNQSASTPKDVADHMGVDMSHVSRALTEFEERGLVELMNPDARKGRIYRLTDKGQEVAGSVESMDVSDGGSA